MAATLLAMGTLFAGGVGFGGGVGNVGVLLPPPPQAESSSMLRAVAISDVLFILMGPFS